METTVNDLVLVYIENAPAFFGRIEDITQDIKPGWYHVHIMVLSIPTRMITWILEQSQINGKVFTMGGTPIRIEKVISIYKSGEETGEIEELDNVISLSDKKDVEEKAPQLEENPKEEEQKEPEESKIISFMNRKKKH